MWNVQLVHPTIEPVASISWHRTNEQQLLTCTNNGIVELVQLRESVPLSWNPLSSIVYSRGTQILEVEPQLTYVCKQSLACEKRDRQTEREREILIVSRVANLKHSNRSKTSRQPCTNEYCWVIRWTYVQSLALPHLPSLLANALQ